MLAKVWVRIPTDATCCTPLLGSYQLWTLHWSDIICALLGFKSDRLYDIFYQVEITGYHRTTDFVSHVDYLLSVVSLMRLWDLQAEIWNISTGECHQNIPKRSPFFGKSGFEGSL